MPAFTTSVSMILIILCSALLASAKTINVTVGDNGTTQDPSKIFQPQEIQANVGDFVVFNFVNGTHSAIESTFAGPCRPAHDSNSSISGFYSGIRDTVNGTIHTTLTVEITKPDQNRTFWFYDVYGCGAGGVGAINANDTDWENFEAFVRNAKRLNGTGDGTSSGSGGRSSTGGPSGTRSSSPTSTGSTGNSAERVGANTMKVISIFTPFLLVMFAI